MVRDEICELSIQFSELRVSLKDSLDSHRSRMSFL